MHATHNARYRLCSEELQPDELQAAPQVQSERVPHLRAGMAGATGRAG